MRLPLTLLLSLALVVPMAPAAAATAPVSDRYDCRTMPIPDLDAWVDDFNAGMAEVPGFRAVDVGSDIDWSRVHIDDGGWRWKFQSLNWVLPAFMAAERRPDGDRALPRARAILHDWYADNRDRPTSDRTWDPMGTGLRAQVLACAATYWPDDPVIGAAMKQHARKLMDPALHAGEWNHGFEQDLGLMAIGCAANRSDWMDRAQEQLSSDADAMIDREGAVSEQAVGYSSYVHRQMTLAAKMIDDCGRPRLEEVERRHLIPLFQAHATRPDGRWSLIGDTRPSDTGFIEGTPVQFAVTQGAKGPHPGDRRAVYDRGWAFSRSGWGEERPFTQESYFALRWGANRQFHGHVDHTSFTWYDRGRPLIEEAGFAGYSPWDFREYERRELAHNQVVVPGKEISWDRGTTLLSQTIDGAHETFLLSGDPYDGVSRKRGLYVNHDLDLVVVHDVLHANTALPFEQLWHLPVDATVTSNGAQAVAHLGKTDLTITQLAPVKGLSVREGETNPIQGWIATADGKRSPAPVLSWSQKGTSAQYVTVLAAGPSGSRPDIGFDGTSLTVTHGGRTQTLYLAPSGAVAATPRSLHGLPEVERLSGDTRIETAVNISRDGFPDQSTDYVVVARADHFADALAGTPLAASRKAPLLLTSPSELSAATERELERVMSRSGRVLLLGGKAAVSTEVEAALRARWNVSRIEGSDRFETATAIAGWITDPRAVMLADGTNFPDALPAGAAAAARKGVILLTAGSEPAPTTQAWLAAHPGLGTTAVGGPAASAHPDAKSIMGGDRYATAAALAKTFAYSPDAISLARGDDFADALAGGAHAARTGQPLLLTPPGALPDSLHTYLCRARSTLTSVHVYGGVNAVSPSVASAVSSLSATC